MSKLALYGKGSEELQTAKSDIQAFAPNLRHIELFTDFDSLQITFFKLDILLIEDCLFYRVLPKIQEIMENSDPQKTTGQKIIITSFTMPITQKQIDIWLDSINSCRNVKIPTSNGFRAERLHDILYFENRERKIYVKSSYDFYKSSLSLKEAMEITANASFASPYVSFWVNLYWVVSITGRNVFLKNGETIPLSQKKAASFRKLYKEYMSNLQ